MKSNINLIIKLSLSVLIVLGAIIELKYSTTISWKFIVAACGSLILLWTLFFKNK